LVTKDDYLKDKSDYVTTIRKDIFTEERLKDFEK